jgi:alpha-beta hydrolase superfamily lysophospholipase
MQQACAEVEYCLGKICSGDYQLALQVWRHPEPRGNLLLVHGYFDHTGLLVHLIHFGLSQGFNVVCFDLPGHGLSSGERAVIDDFADYSRAIKDVLCATGDLPGSWQVMAQSAGAAAVMDYLQTIDDRRFRKVVLLAPLVRPRGWRQIRLGHMLLYRWHDTIKRTFTVNPNNPEFSAFLQKDPLQARIISVRWIGALQSWLEEFLQRDTSSCPLLVIQGDDDETVDWKYNLRQIQRLFPRWKLVQVAGGRHHLANESPANRKLYLHRVSEYLEG